MLLSGAFVNHWIQKSISISNFLSFEGHILQISSFQKLSLNDHSDLPTKYQS